MTGSGRPGSGAAGPRWAAPGPQSPRPGVSVAARISSMKPCLRLRQGSAPVDWLCRGCSCQREASCLPDWFSQSPADAGRDPLAEHPACFPAVYPVLSQREMSPPCLHEWQLLPGSRSVSKKNNAVVIMKRSCRTPCFFCL